MHRFEIQDFELSYISELSKIVEDTWHINNDFGKGFYPKDYLSYCYVKYNYNLSDYSKMILVDGKFAGIIFGRINKNFKFFDYFKGNFKNFFMGLNILLKNKVNFFKLFRFLKKDKKIVFEKKNNEFFDTEVTLFIVDPSFRGLGIGRKLMNDFKNYCKNNNVKYIYLYTDSMCNINFYDKYGFKQIFKRLNSVKIEKKKINYYDYIYIMKP
ncbi:MULTISPECIES: GNAT family N-acetyltransferase [Oceanotoga]|uniref:Acetyltransferase (GNAT) family protein n=1 Tax=Oceanotoga teriensis TaxID=515440 RepID=A0AA45C6T4_9BACT|nr:MULTISPECIES: GNAT family N-acetyltransferase [Oceanotoga]MDN5342826.1 hypothetical protein [Oceanotoga sp.]MDO7977793.1 GNAT family N-acetyltransferase [Oceanotoga teriensis]PWJ93204.1 acetyltransferase (GNAT) family protein [Oceanotoga teriensis]